MNIKVHLIEIVDIIFKVLLRKPVLISEICELSVCEF